MPDRSAAKASIVTRDGDDPEFTEAISRARGLEVTLAGHRHDQVMRDKELGLVGRFMGGEKNAPMTVALIALLVSLGVFGAAHAVIAFSAVDASRVTSLISAADKCLALATLALGYVCGKSSN